MSRKPMRALAALAVTLAGMGLLTSCAATRSPGRAARATPSPARSSLANPQRAAGPRGVTDRIILSKTTVVAGVPIKGALIVVNSTGRRINLNRGCGPQFTVALTNGHVPADVAFAAICSARPFFLKPGVNRLRVTVLTTYRQCTSDRGTPGRRCLSGHRMPPLHAGHYRAVLVSVGLHVPAPAPVRVTLRD